MKPKHLEQELAAELLIQVLGPPTSLQLVKTAAPLKSNSDN